MKPGRHFDEILKQAYELQIDGMNDKDEILQALRFKITRGFYAAIGNGLLLQNNTFN